MLWLLKGSSGGRFALFSDHSVSLRGYHRGDDMNSSDEAEAASAAAATLLKFMWNACARVSARPSLHALLSFSGIVFDWARASWLAKSTPSVYLPPLAGVGQETGAASDGGAAVQGLGRSGAVTPAGNRNSATGVTGTLPPARPAPPPRPPGAGGGGIVPAEQRGTIWSALARA